MAAAPLPFPSSERFTGETVDAGIEFVFISREPEEPVVRIFFGLTVAATGEGKLSSYCNPDEWMPFLTIRSGLLTRSS